MRRALGPTLLALAVAMAVGGNISWADPQKFDIPDSVVAPAMIYEFRQLEQEEPENTIFKVDGARLTFPSLSGNLNRVAEYQSAESGVYLQNLYFMRALQSGILTIEADTAGWESRRLLASYKDPGTVEFQVTDTKVYHRLEHNQPGVDIDFNPGATYATSWERVRGDLNVGLAKSDPQVSLVASFESQTRLGDQQHTSFQLHRNNCTDCHTFSASQGINQTTNSWKVGAQASLGNRTSLYAAFGGSNFNDTGTLLSYNFGGPFSNAVNARNNSQDSITNLQAYTGNKDYRVGAAYYSLSRTSDQSPQNFKANYFSASAAYQPVNELLLTAGHYSEDETNSLAASLSTSKRSFYVEANGYPTNWLTMRLRLGQDESNYRIGAGALLQSPLAANSKDSYYDARVDVRPNMDLRLGARLRGDDISQPFFAISPARKDLFEAWATWSPNPVVVGVNYRRNSSSNSIYASAEETISAYLNAVINDNLNFYSTYSVTELAQNSNGPVFLQDALGLPQQLQIGYPYTAHMSVFSAGLDFAIGDLRTRPYYRQMNSRSQGLFLPGSTPSFTDDTRLNLRQSAYGLHVELPAWEGTSLGLGWEFQDWVDQLRALNNGTVNFYSVDFRTRF